MEKEEEGRLRASFRAEWAGSEREAERGCKPPERAQDRPQLKVRKVGMDADPVRRGWSEGATVVVGGCSSILAPWPAKLKDRRLRLTGSVGSRLYFVHRLSC